MRRDKRYRKDFLDFISNFKKSNPKEYRIAEYDDFNNLFIVPYLSKFKKELRYFTKKYKVIIPANPDIPFNCLGFGRLKDCKKNKKSSDWNFSASGFLSLIFCGNIKPIGAVNLKTKRTWINNFKKDIKNICFLNLKYESLKKEDIPKKIILEVDLTYSKKDIMERLKQIISEIDEVRKSINFVTYSNTRKRRDKYDLYLKIWDLHTEGKLFKEIARKLFPREYKEESKKVESFGADENKRGKLFQKYFRETKDEELAYRKAYGFGGAKSSNKAIQKVIDSFNAAKKLAEGGYIEIR